MRRLARTLVNTATVVSLVLCVSTVALWGRSYFIADTVHARSSVAYHAAVTSTRGILCGTGRHRPLPPQMLQRMRRGAEPPPDLAEVRPAGYARGAPFDVAVWVPPPGAPGLRHAFSLAGVSWAVADGGPLPGGGYGAAFWQATVPHGFVSAAFALLPLARLVLRIRRPSPGLCPACGYDLRATPTRCPECGTPTPAAPTTS